MASIPGRCWARCFGGGLAEIYAYGLRNPYSFHFDLPSGRLILGDVGQNSVEEIDVVSNGGNYGWHLKEGTFSFAVNSSGTGIVTADIPGTPNFLTDPLIEYDHDEGIAVIGGFVYHGSAIPALDGKYIFGDLSMGFASPSGRLFYGDLATGEIRQLIIGTDNRSLGIYLKGLGQDANGELYVLGSTALGPSGTGGMVYRIVPVPEPATVLLLALGGLAFFSRRRRQA
jgi:glucose/arabinose dehydrogenase